MFKETMTVFLTGISVVFVGLVCIIGIISLMSFFVRLFNHETRSLHRKHEEVLPEHTGFTPGTITAPGVDRLAGKNRRELIAAVSAAVAEYMGSDIEGIRIHSIKRVGGESELSLEERRQLVAVISAAIAEEMGEDVSAIRIRSIKKAA